MPISITIQPLTLSDGPQIGLIGKAAFSNDRQTMLKSAISDYDHEKDAQEPLPYFLSVPQRMTCIKAVDEASGQMLGYAIWGFRGYTEEEIPTPHGRGAKAVPEPEQEQEKEKATEEQNTKEESSEQDALSRLTTLTDADMRSWMAKLMPPGSKCIFVVTLSVDPAYSSSGVGTALMSWAMDRADEDSVFFWVHASEDSWRFYQKFGFETLGDLKVELDEFADGIQAPFGDGRWGSYTFRYMKREAKTKD